MDVSTSDANRNATVEEPKREPGVLNTLKNMIPTLVGIVIFTVILAYALRILEYKLMAMF
ncbi:MAG: hypothetical protein J5959_20490 [Butyrivibrio sp.]|nr:hypothetical protein [Butyrivibrio sp.]